MASISPGPGAPETGDVHLGTGQVNLSVPLATIDAGPEVGYELSLSYSSAAAGSAGIWNEDAPTSLVGLGWSLNRDCVARIPGGSVADLNVLLMLSGGAYPLLKCGTDADGDIYQSQAFAYWTIRYDAACDQWLVIKEDGVRYVFGGNAASPTAPNQSIEWAVQRGNWLGSSAQGGQQQVAMIWNLAAQEDQWGNRLQFFYEQTLVMTGSWGGYRKHHTQSCRLWKIQSTNGRTVKLQYSDKDACEYVRPHENASSQTRCELRVDFTAFGNWDILGAPDPTLKIWLGSDPTAGRKPMYEQSWSDKWAVSCKVPLPLDSADVVIGWMEVWDYDPIGSDEPMLRTSFELTANAETQRYTKGTGASKGASAKMEYVHADLQPGGPNAFQDRYEQKFLSEVQLCDPSDRVLVSTSLQYGALGSDKLRKRLLVAVTPRTADGTPFTQPLSFTYFTEADGVTAEAPFQAQTGASYGAVKSRTLPSGATVSYQYSQYDIASAPLDIEIHPPKKNTKNWCSPSTYLGPGYNVVIWRGRPGSIKANKISLGIYDWVGYWSFFDAGEKQVADPAQVIVRLGPDFVALGLGTKAEPLWLIAQDPLNPTQWQGSTPSLPDEDVSKTLIEAGVGFVAVLCPDTGDLLIFEKYGTQWQSKPFSLGIARNSVYALAARDRYAFAFYADPDDPSATAYLFHRQQPFDWKCVTQGFDSLWPEYKPGAADSLNPTSVSVQVKSRKTLSCQPAATFVAIQVCHDLYFTTAGNPTLSHKKLCKHLAIRWSDDLGQLLCELLGDVVEVGAEIPVEDVSVHMAVVGDTVSLDTVYSGVIGELNPKSRKHIYRFLGGSWDHRELKSDVVSNNYHGSDACTVTWNGTAQYYQFEPNLVDWRPQMPPYQDGNPTLFERWWPVIYFVEGIVTLPVGGWLAFLIDIAFQAADFAFTQYENKGASGSGFDRYFTAGNKVYFQDHCGAWSQIGSLSTQVKDAQDGTARAGAVDRHSTQNASRYVAYIVKLGNKSYNRVQFLRNGALWGEPIDLPDGESLRRSKDSNETLFIGPECFFSYSGGDSLDQASALHLYRIDRGRFQGAQTTRVVSRVTVDDGFAALCCEYDYDMASALPAAAGGVVQFGKVTTYFVGAPGTPRNSNGSRESHFYARPATLPPPLSPQAAGELTKYASLFSGLEYASRILDASGSELARSVQRFQVFEPPLGQGPQRGYFIRPTQRTERLQGTNAVSTITYSLEARGQPVQTEVESYDVRGTLNRSVTEYAYAFQQPSYAADLLQLNLLTPLCRTTHSTSDETTGSGQTTGIEVATWARAGDGSRTSPSLNRSFPLMAPVATYRALQPGATFDFGGDSPDATQWTCVGSVLCRNLTVGVVTESDQLSSEDGPRLVQSIVYDASGHFAVAAFLNASVCNDQAGYYGYQDYEDQHPWTLTQTGSVLMVQPERFSPRPDATAYVASAYVQPRSGGTGGSIGFGAERKTVAATSGAWEYVETVTRSPNASAKPFVQCDGLIRDFRFAPIDAPFSATTYDASTGRVLSEIDVNGLKREYHVDELLRPQAVIEPQGTVHQLFWSVAAVRDPSGFAPRQDFAVVNRSAGNYIPSVPASSTNSIRVVIIDQDGDPDRPARDAIIQMQTSSAVDPIKKPKLTIELEIDGGPTAKYESDSGSVSLGDQRTKLSAPFLRWRLVAMGTRAWLWLDDQLVLSCTRSAPVKAKKLVVKVHGDDTSGHLPRQIYGAYNPVLSCVYSDALGRPVQTQSLREDSSGLIVAQALYDGWGNAAVRTLPVLYQDDVTWGYKSDCVTGFDAVTGVMQGRVATGYQDSYPYSRALAESNPLARTIAQGLPGQDYQVGSPRALRIAYGPNPDVAALLQRLSLGAEAAGRYSAQTIYSPGAAGPVPEVSLFDLVQSPIASSVGSGDAALVDTLQASWPSGLLVTTYLPPAAPKDTSAPVPYASVVNHDFLAHPTASSSPDRGTTRFIHDHAGHLRFCQSQEQITNDPQTVLYCKYDALGRLVERGLLSNTPWDAPTLQALAEQPAYPEPQTPGYSARELYSYDSTGGTDTNCASNLKQRLYQAVRRDAAGQTVTETFTYDAYGNITGTTLQATLYDGLTRQTSLTYDLMGNVLSIAYPYIVGKKPTLTVLYDHTLLGRVKNIGIHGAPEQYASYTYDLAGRPSQVLLNYSASHTSYGMQRSYSYDLQGHLLKIVDKCGDEGLFQEELGYLDAAGRYLAGRIAQLDSQRYTYGDPGWLTQAASNVISYDLQGNLEHLQDTSGARDLTHVSQRNQVAKLTRSGQTSVEFSYTPDGNLRASDKLLSVTYDPLSRMPVAYKTAAEVVVSFGHDSRLQRVYKSVSAPASSRLYVRGPGPRPLVELSGSAQTEYIFGPQGMIAIIDGGSTMFVSQDHLGSTRVLSDSKGKLVEQYGFDPFGALIRVSAGDPPKARYLFTGQEYDAEASLYHFRVRFYDPDIGTFYAPDPAEEYYSPYIYCRNDPVDRIDPSGRASTSVFWELARGQELRLREYRRSATWVEMNLDHPVIVVPRGDPAVARAAYAFANANEYSIFNVVEIAGRQKVDWQHNGTMILLTHGSRNSAMIQTGLKPLEMRGYQGAKEVFDHMHASQMLKGVNRVEIEACYAGLPSPRNRVIFSEKFADRWWAEREHESWLRRVRGEAAAPAESITVTGRKGMSGLSHADPSEFYTLRGGRSWLGTKLAGAFDLRKPGSGLRSYQR